MILKLRSEFGKFSDYVYSGGSYVDNIKRNIPNKEGALKPDELPSPTSDMIFKLMFTKEETKKYACLVFSSILDVDYLVRWQYRIWRLCRIL